MSHAVVVTSKRWLLSILPDANLHFLTNVSVLWDNATGSSLSSMGKFLELATQEDTIVQDSQPLLI